MKLEHKGLHERVTGTLQMLTVKSQGGLKACPDLENILNSPYKNLKKYISYPEGWENSKSKER